MITTMVAVIPSQAKTYGNRLLVSLIIADSRYDIRFESTFVVWEKDPPGACECYVLMRHIVYADRTARRRR